MIIGTVEPLGQLAGQVVVGLTLVMGGGRPRVEADRGDARVLARAAARGRSRRGRRALSPERSLTVTGSPLPSRAAEAIRHGEVVVA